MIKNPALLTSVFSAVLLQNGIRMSTCALNSKFSHETGTVISRSPPGLNSGLKLWWTKQVTPEYYVAGRLSRRQLQYAAEGGFKSVVSLFTYENDKDCCLGMDYLPATSKMATIAKESGLQFRTVMDSAGTLPSSADSVSQLKQALNNIPTPVLVLSDRGYSATFTLFMYLLNYDKNFTMDRAAAISHVLGMDLSMKCTNQKLCKVTGENVEFSKLDNLPKQWLNYWHAIPVYKNWFVAGQILESHIPRIMQAGFKSVVNLRAGTTHKGKPAQEKVTLMNIADNSKTYGDENLGPRQSIDALKQKILDPLKENSYVSPNSSHNFATSNPEEFGDLIGYNEDLEKLAFRKAGFPYYHLPVVNSEPFSAELFALYQPELMDAINRGPVLVHCASSKRAAYIAVLAAAVQHNHDLSWALTKLSDLGLPVSPDRKADIYDMYVGILSGDRKGKNRNSNNACKESCVKFNGN